MGRFIKSHWFMQSNRTVIEDGAESILKARGIQIVDAKEFLFPKLNYERCIFITCTKLQILCSTQFCKS